MFKHFPQILYIFVNFLNTFNCCPTRGTVQVNTLDQLGLVVYHEGSDGGQLDWVEMQTSDGALVRCNLGTNIFSSASNIFSSVQVSYFYRSMDGRLLHSERGADPRLHHLQPVIMSLRVNHCRK